MFGLPWRLESSLPVGEGEDCSPGYRGVRMDFLVVIAGADIF